MQILRKSRAIQSVCYKNKSRTHQLKEIFSTTYQGNILQMEQNEYRKKFIMQLQVNGKKLNFEIQRKTAEPL